jgi:hypothetical protein
MVTVMPGTRSPNAMPAALVLLAVVANVSAALAGHVIGDLRQGEFYMSLILALWTSSPWLTYWLMARRSLSRRAAVATGLLVIALYFSIYAKVFVFPTSSTDAVAIVVMPFLAFAILAFALLGDMLLRRER